MRQWFQHLKRVLIGWMVQFALKLLVKLSVEAIQELPWESWGIQLNGKMDKKLTKTISDKMQIAVADGVTLFLNGLRS